MTVEKLEDDVTGRNPMDADETIQDACDLALEDGGREGWIRQWKELLHAVEEVIELEDGCELRLPPESRWIEEAGRLIAGDRQCCSELQFELIAEAGSGPIRVRFLGPEGAGDSLMEEVEAVLPGKGESEERDGLRGERKSRSGSRPVGDVETIDRDGVRTLIEEDADVTLVEALPEDSYREEHLPGAVHLPPTAVRERAPTLLPDRGQTVIVYCAGPDCGLSTRTARLLESMGYRDVREYPGGKSDWREAGYWFETGMPALARAG